MNARRKQAGAKQLVLEKRDRDLVIRILCGMASEFNLILDNPERVTEAWVKQQQRKVLSIAAHLKEL